MNKLTKKYTMWVARDKSGQLYFYRTKPRRGLRTFIPAEDYCHFGRFYDKFFEEITWENSPQLVEFTAKPINLCK